MACVLAEILGSTKRGSRQGKASRRTQIVYNLNDSLVVLASSLRARTGNTGLVNYAVTDK